MTEIVVLPDVASLPVGHRVVSPDGRVLRRFAVSSPAGYGWPWVEEGVGVGRPARDVDVAAWLVAAGEVADGEVAAMEGN